MKFIEFDVMFLDQDEENIDYESLGISAPNIENQNTCYEKTLFNIDAILLINKVTEDKNNCRLRDIYGTDWKIKGNLEEIKETLLKIKES